MPNLPQNFPVVDAGWRRRDIQLERGTAGVVLVRFFDGHRRDGIFQLVLGGFVVGRDVPVLRAGWRRFRRIGLGGGVGVWPGELEGGLGLGRVGGLYEVLEAAVLG